MTKKEIHVSKTDARNIFLSILVPFLLIFIIEHFGKFEYIGYGGVSISEVRVSSLTFTTPFGNKIYDDVSGQGMGYERQSDGTRVINGSYSGKLPYYLKGMIEDIVYPFILIAFLLLLAVLNAKYKFKLH